MTGEQMHDHTRRLELLLLTREIEAFLYTEAELLDTRRFNTREHQDINWFDEGKATLTQRVQQILTGVHWAEEPLSRVCHMVSNVQVVQVALPEVTVACRFLVYRNRLQDETDLFVGKREDVLRQVDGQWQIARRKILLDQNVLLAKNLTLFF